MPHAPTLLALTALVAGYLLGRIQPYDRIAARIDRHTTERAELWGGPVGQWALLTVLILIGPALLAQDRRRRRARP
ncbi:hypothetical protein ACIRF8_12700 [Streptomyces sp. NPDC102406]|uniref:hypothetical protein n=1 Tax=Streptomyces sp. NPDC102406 TaxID=3366171 RepID=UPI003818AEF1